jgi:hypothetical protein
VTVTFSDGGFAGADLLTTNAAVQNFVAVSASNYTFTLVASNAGVVSADLPAGACTNAYGLMNSAAQFSRYVDPTAPARWRSGTGDWAVATNWEPSVVPQAGDSVVITNAGSLVYLTNATPALASLQLGGTLVLSNWDTAVSATTITVRAGGVVTCAGPFTTTRCRTASGSPGNLTVASGGASTTGRGMRGDPIGRWGNGPGRRPFGRRPWGQGGDATHSGGLRGSGLTYGTNTVPLLPGSGGGVSTTLGSLAGLSHPAHTIDVQGTHGRWVVGPGELRGRGSGGSILLQAPVAGRAARSGPSA